MQGFRFLIFAVVFFASLFLMFINMPSKNNNDPQVMKETTLESVRDQAKTFAGKWDRHEALALGLEYEPDGISVLNHQILPIEGRAAIVDHFSNAFADESPMKGSTLKIETHQVQDLESGFGYADGSYQLVLGSGEVLEDGKWGNVFKNSTEGPRLVQESAHKNIGPEDYLTPPSGDDPHASLAEITIDDPGFAEHGDRFEKAWAAQDVDAIAATFAENAVRIVGTAPEAIRGRAAIRDSFSAAFAEGSQFQGSTLSAIILGYRVLDEQHFIANGVWKILDQSGTILARGQWGNLYHRDDNGQVSFLMESAGAMVFDQE